MFLFICIFENAASYSIGYCINKIQVSEKHMLNLMRHIFWSLLEQQTNREGRSGYLDHIQMA